MKKNVLTIFTSVLVIIIVLALEIYVALTGNRENAIRYLTDTTQADRAVPDTPTDLPETLNKQVLRQQILRDIDRLTTVETDAKVSVCARFVGSNDSLVIDPASMLSASLIKLFIAGCTYENMDSVVDYTGSDDEVRALLESLITVSDNRAAEVLVTFLGNGNYSDGITAVNQYCQKHQFFETHMGELIPETGEHEDNMTSAMDCADFFSAICEKKLIGSEEMLNLLSMQTRTQKIPGGVPDTVKTANKTGELEDTENDAAIVFLPGKEYILCVMCTNVSDTELARETIVNISTSVYYYVNNLPQTEPGDFPVPRTE